MSEKPLPSPCIRNCTLDNKSDICLGCGRTLAEIGEWSDATRARQEEIVAAATLRRASMRRSGS
jgi:predicted Fe-S protein YdhL (DUF1289 family)